MQRNTKRPPSPIDPDGPDGPTSEKCRTLTDTATVKAAHGLKCTFHGNVYQLFLLIHFYQQGLKGGRPFDLSTEDPDAEKFDDLIYEFVDETLFLLLQAKHKLEKTKMNEKITFNDLATKDESKEFSLLKYFKSYLALKKKKKFKDKIKHLIICTNTDFENPEDLKRNGINTQEVPPNDLMKFPEAFKSKTFKLSIAPKSPLQEALKEAFDINVLANTLAECITQNQQLTLSKDIFKLYHVALVQEKVIDVEHKTFHQHFIDKNQHSKLSDSAKMLWELLNAKKIDWNTELKLSESFGTPPELAPYDLYRLAIELVIHIKTGKQLTLKKEVLRKYHFLLVKEKVLLIEKNNSSFHPNFLSGTGLSDGAKLLHLVVTNSLTGEEMKKKVQITKEFGKLKDPLKGPIKLPSDVTEEQIKKYLLDEKLPKKTTDDQKEIEDFFKLLTFAVNQPNVDELWKINCDELNFDFELTGIEMLSDHVQGNMLNWFTDPQSKPKTEEDAKKLMESTCSHLCELQILGCSILSKTRFPNIQFETEYLPNQAIADFLEVENKNKLLIVQGESLFLIGMKLNQILLGLKGKTQNNYIFQDLSEFSGENMTKMILSAFERITLVVISCNQSLNDVKVYRVVTKLLDKQKSCQDLKIIFLVESETDDSLEAFTDKNYVKEKIIHRGLSDLTAESQENLLSKFEIKFQGEPILLEYVFNKKDLKNKIYPELLSRIIKQEEVVIGNDIPISSGYNKELYIPRELFNSLRISVKELELINFKNGHRLVIISDTPGMGKSTLTTRLAVKLKEQNSNLWVFKIDLNDCSPFLKTKNDTKKSYFTTPKETISFLLEMLELNGATKKDTLERELITISLTKYGNITILFDGFDEISPTYKDIVLGLVTALQEYTKFQKLVITTRPHVKNELEERLNVISFQMKPLKEEEQKECLKKIWSKCLKTTDENQHLLEKYVEDVLEKLSYLLKDRDSELIGVPLHITMLAEVFQTSSGNEKKDWEGCQEYLQSTEEKPPKLLEKIDLIDLYELFVEKKVNDIYYRDKLKRDSSKPGNQEDQKKLYNCFVIDHQILAMTIIFPKEYEELQSTEEQEQIETLKKAIIEGKERKGIITQVVNNQPHFVHLTFAEYFAAKYLFQNLDQMVANISKPAENHNICKLLKDILTGNGFKFLRAFLNGLLGKNSKKHKPNIIKIIDDLQIDIRTVFREAALESNCHIINALVSKMEPSKKDTMLCNLFSNSKCIYVHKTTTIPMAELLCDLQPKISDEFIKSVICTGRFEVFKVLCDKGAELKLLHLKKKIRMFKDLLKCSEYSFQQFMNIAKMFSPQIDTASKYDIGGLLWVTAKHGSFEILQWLITKKPVGAGIGLENNKTILHYAVDGINLAMCREIRETLFFEDAYCQDAFGKTPIYYAAETGQWTTVHCFLGKAITDSEVKNWSINLLLRAMRKDLKMCTWILENKLVDVNFQDTNGKKIIDGACLDVVHYLTEKGETENDLKKLKIPMLLHTRHKNYGKHYWKGQKQIDAADDRRHWKNVSDLLEKGATGTGEHLIEAAFYGQLNIVQLLVEKKGIDINYKYKDGYTALETTTSNEVQSWLLKNGATFSIEYLLKKVGRRRRNLEICQILFKDRGSKIIIGEDGWKRILNESSKSKQSPNGKKIWDKDSENVDFFKLIVESENNPIKTKESLKEATAINGCEEVKNWIEEKFQ
jgi:hypothetical protein